VLDLFSGTARVGHALKARGFRVVANDHNAYAEVLARCYVEADVDQVASEAGRAIAAMREARPVAGWFTETYCRKARFIHPRNGERIEGMRQWVAGAALGPEVEAVVLTSLLEASDRVDSTTGVQMAFLKDWAPRAGRTVDPRMPAVLPRAASGKGLAVRLDALDAARRFEADVVYLDPPYNQHSYLGNYHVWETLIRWDNPETFGLARKRVEVRQRRSPFNSRVAIEGAMAALLASVRARRGVVVSFNNEGFLARERLEALLGGLWGGNARLRVVESDYPRYVGARIGIYNPAGVKVGKVSHLRNKEYLFVAEPPTTAERTGRSPLRRKSTPGTKSSPGTRTSLGLKSVSGIKTASVIKTVSGIEAPLPVKTSTPRAEPAEKRRSGRKITSSRPTDR
jgi:adenine-specific DNA-methyltransferase